jgi:single stranded DNA-binding protein
MANPTKNRVEITGYLAATPELRNLPSGSMCANIVAYTKRGRKRGMDLIIERERHQLVAYGDLAHAAARLQKGQLVQFVGRLHTDAWKDKVTGHMRYATKIVVAELAAVTRLAASDEITADDADDTDDPEDAQAATT